MKVWEFYENLNEIVYAVKIDDYTIEYINKKAIHDLEYEALENVKGKKCYEVLQKRSEKCPFCTTKYLKEGQFYEWDYYNPITKHLYNLKDTIVVENGVHYQMEIAIDMTRQMKQREIIQKYMNNEAKLNEGLRMALAESDPNLAIQVLLEYIGKLFHGKKAYIYELAEDDTLTKTYMWTREAIAMKTGKSISLSTIDQWFHIFTKNDNVAIRNIEDIKDEMPDAHQYLKNRDVKSLIVSPIMNQKEIIGFYGIENPIEEMIEHTSSLLSMISYFIYSFIKRRNMVSELENLSYYDQMTGLKNRHALKEFSKEYKSELSVGIVFTDVTGLKYVNDNYGHDAGDKLLLNAVKCMKESFAGAQLYRLGGDEFLVVVENADNEKVLESIQILREKLVEAKVKMSIGYVYEENFQGNFDDLINKADMEMYLDKRKYYNKI